MTGTKTRRAATAVGFIWTDPPISKTEAESLLGRDIPDQAWSGIVNAYELYLHRLNDLTATKSSRKKDDPQGWTARQTATTKALEAALAKIEAAQRHGNFLREASENHAIQQFGHSKPATLNAHLLLNEAFDSVLKALVIIERAQPREVELPTEATARDLAVRDIFAALRSGGIEARASFGATLGQLERVTVSDLTLFEQLISALQIGDERRPAAFSAFIRAALAGEIKG